MDQETEIYDWTAQRSGAFITVTGKTREGAPTRFAKVSYISNAEHDVGQRPLAVREDGTRCWLMS